MSDPNEPTAGAAPTNRPTGRRRSDRFVGASTAASEVIALAASAARSDAPTIVVGPPGSGKEHVARAIHSWSPRSNGEFIVLSASGVEHALQARELFGFPETSEATPATGNGHDGALGRAARGTLLVKGIEHLASSARQALIQALKNQSYQREGSRDAIPLSARVVATTENGGESLFGDIRAQVIRVAPLSQRPEDVLPLAAHFLAIFSDEEGVSPVGFTTQARRWLVEEPWGGNVRELRERIRQAVRLAGDGSISVEALLLSGEGEEVPSFKEAKRGFETRYVEALLRRCRGNISRAARLAKKDRKDFYDVIRRTGVNPGAFRS